METIHLLDSSTARTAIFLAKAYSHKIRRQILELLMACPEGSNVTDIYTKIKTSKGRYMEQSICSQHLAWLRKYKLVSTRREGKQIIYSVNTAVIEKTGSLITELAQLATATASN